MIRFALLLGLMVVIARAFWRAVDGILEGLSGPRGARTPQRSAQMMRDPVCGTFVLPDQAVALTDGSHRVYFCSTLCRDKYRARTA
jgi:hypothetical protein